MLLLLGVLLALAELPVVALPLAEAAAALLLLLLLVSPPLLPLLLLLLLSVTFRVAYTQNTVAVVEGAVGCGGNAKNKSSCVSTP